MASIHIGRATSPSSIISLRYTDVSVQTDADVEPITREEKMRALQEWINETGRSLVEQEVRVRADQMRYILEAFNRNVEFVAAGHLSTLRALRTGLIPLTVIEGESVETGLVSEEASVEEIEEGTLGASMHISRGYMVITW